MLFLMMYSIMQRFKNMEHIRQDIKHLIHRAKKHLQGQERMYYPCMANVQFSFFCHISGDYITVETDNKQYFIDRFGMDDDLTITNNITNGNEYWTLYYNALIVMLEQSLNDPRPIINESLSRILLIYKHSGNDKDNIDSIDLVGTDMVITGLDSDTTEFKSNVEDYVNYVTEKWDGVNTAYNIYRYESSLQFDTYPRI